MNIPDFGKSARQANERFRRARMSSAGKGYQHRNLNRAYWDAPFWKAREERLRKAKEEADASTGSNDGQ